MGKVIGYFLIIAIFVTAAFYLALGQKPKKTSTSAAPTPSLSGTPTPISTKITVYAAGTPANNEYPTMELRIDGVTVQTWKDVKGDAKNGKFDAFIYNFPGVISGQVLQVAFTNDFYIAPDEDRNLYVDRIVVGNTTYVADSPATLTTITDKTDKKCNTGMTYSRWLFCNGYFTFKSFDQAFIPQPTPVARMLTGSMIKVYAAGKFVGGDTPAFDLKIKDKVVASFHVAGDPLNRILGEYDYLSPDKVKITDISIIFTNDWYANTTDDRNLYVDRVNLDGIDYFTDSPNVYETGIWAGGKCAEGYLRSKLLWCGGASMRFGARTTPAP